MATTTKPKLDLKKLFDSIFRKTVFLQPQPNGSFQAINLTLHDKGYYKDDIGSTTIEPNSIRKVRGLKNVEYICLKQYGDTKLLNAFEGKQPVVCPNCKEEVWNPNSQMTEKSLADLIDMAESAGRLQAEKENNPVAANQMKMVLMGIVVVGVLLLWMIMSGGK